MIFSISAFREFQRCRYKWLLNEKIGSRSDKDAYRKEIYHLSQLESIDAWRGKIVDYTIGEYIIPKLQKKRPIIESEVIEFAKKLARARFEFAKLQRHKENGLKKTEHDYDFAALYNFEYTNSSLNLNDKLKKSWEEIEIALINFLSNNDLLQYLKSSDYLVTQRPLTYKLHNFTIKGVPDLIAFSFTQPPHIFDWKVHYYGIKNYNEQLLIYAIALINGNAHRDFQQYMRGFTLQDIKVSEYQLLTNTIRDYSITEDNIEMINDYIAEGIERMRLKKCDLKYEELNSEDFEKTANIDNCSNCQFKKICKED